MFFISVAFDDGRGLHEAASGIESLSGTSMFDGMRRAMLGLLQKISPLEPNHELAPLVR